MGTPPIPVVNSDGAQLVALDGNASFPASAPYTPAPLGYQQIANLTVAANLTVPGNATFALVQAEMVDVRWRDDGPAPTATVGMLLPSGLPEQFSGNLAALKFITVSSGSILNMSYYK